MNELDVYTKSDYEMHTKYYDKYLTPRKLRWFTGEKSIITKLTDELLYHILSFVLYPHQINCPHRTKFNVVLECIPKLFRTSQHNMLIFYKEWHVASADLPDGTWTRDTCRKIEVGLSEPPSAAEYYTFNVPYVVFEYQLNTHLKNANKTSKKFTIHETTNVPAKFEYDEYSFKKMLDWYSEIKTPEQKFDDVFWGDDY